MASTTFIDGSTIIVAAWLNDVNDFVYNAALPPSFILDVDNGGTGADNDTDARVNLGLEIGVDVQAYDPFLAALAGLSNGIVVKTTGSAVSRTITGTANKITVTNGDGVSGNPTLTVGSDVYQVGGTDVAIADGGTGASTAADARTNLGLGTLATQNGTFSGTSSGTNTGDQLTFKTFSVSGQSDVVADGLADTITFAAGSNMTITTNAGTDTITFTSSGGGGGTTPGGADTQVQYNAAGVFGGDSGMVTDGAGTVEITGSLAVDNILINGNTVSSTDTDGDIVLDPDGTGTVNIDAVAITGGSITGITDLAVADGGTGASDAADARTNLGLVIGTNVQAYDAELAAIAGLTSAANKGIMFTGAGTAGTYDLTAAALTVLDDATVAAMVDTLGGASSTGTGGLVRTTSPTLVTPLLGTPTSGNLANCTGLPIATGVDNLGTGVATFLTTPSSANLISAVTDETGTGALVFANTPTLVTPVLGAATATTINAAAITAPTTTVGGNIILKEGTDNGTNTITLQAPASTANVTATFQAVSGDVYVSTGTDVPVTDGGTGVSTMTTAYAPVCAGTTATGALQVADTGLATSGFVLTSTGASSLPTFQAPSGGGSLVLLSSATPTGVASADFGTVFTSTYTTYVIELINLFPVTDGVNLWLRISDDSGVSYEAGAADYAWSNIGYTMATSPAGNGTGDNSDAQIILNDTGNTIGNAAGEGCSFTIKVFDPSAATVTPFTHHGYTATGATIRKFVVGAAAQIVAAAVTGFQVLFSSGNIATGTIKVYGMKAT